MRVNVFKTIENVQNDLFAYVNRVQQVDLTYHIESELSLSEQSTIIHISLLLTTVLVLFGFSTTITHRKNSILFRNRSSTIS